MALFGKRSSGPGAKVAQKSKQISRLFERGKEEEAAQNLHALWEEKPSDLEGEPLESLVDLMMELQSRRMQQGKVAEAFEIAKKIVSADASKQPKLAERFVEAKQTESRFLKFIAEAVEKDPESKRLLLQTAKEIYKAKGEDLNADEMDFVAQAAHAYPLWKDGLGVLADNYLSEGRKDAKALEVYRNAYPNRKADRLLREVLVDSLIENREKDEFAAGVYKDVVETSDNPAALELLAEHYIEDKQLQPSTMPYIERAMEKSELNEEALNTLAEFLMSAESDFVDRLELGMKIYRQGCSDRNLLIFLSESLAEQNKFDDEAISIMTKAFEMKVVSKRSVLILTEHCLANERTDEFAIRVYETYLSTWPDRPQRQIYNILSYQYADLTRVDEQAQKIYEEALVDTPTDPVIVNILARAYHAADKRDDQAERLYRQAFPSASEEVGQQIATILAEMRVAAGVYNDETLRYLTKMGRPSSGPLKETYDSALTNCFLASGRRGEQAQEAYFALFEKTENSDELNPKLVQLLAEIIKERGEVPATNSTSMRVYRKLFQLEKFSADPEISFILLEDELRQSNQEVNLTQLAVRCFEADQEQIVEMLKKHKREQMLQEIGDFYIEHYNFNLAAAAYTASYKVEPTEQIRYRLAKIQLLDGSFDEALKHLEGLTSKEFAVQRKYWEAAAYQQSGDAKRSAQLLEELPKNDGIPAYLVDLRGALNLELEGKLEESLKQYEKLSGNSEFEQFQRWIALERGIVMLKLGRLEESRDHLQEVHRLNPNGRAEQLFYSLSLFYLGEDLLEKGKLDAALPLFTKSVEINRSHRLLRKAIVDLLSIYGQKAFFGQDLPTAARILEVAHRILPKNSNTRMYLAYTYHLMDEYARALIYYRDIQWDSEMPQLERSQAYAFLANQQPEKAWRVFQDLTKRDNLNKENFPRMVGAFLEDSAAEGTRSWEKVEFPEYASGMPLIALLMHDGLYERAISVLDKLIAIEPENLAAFWYLGRAYSKLNKRDMAVFNWKQLLALCGNAQVSPNTKIRQFTEIGVAFLEAGYANEAMQTWEELRKLDEKNPDLPKLYAFTLDLNAYNLARKDQLKLAREEWKKALKYAPDEPALIQNYAICCMMLSDFDDASQQFHKVKKVWQAQINQDPRTHGGKRQWIEGLERTLNTISLTKGRSDFDLTKVRAEDAIGFYQRANQFYWILGLDKSAHRIAIEREYFRLIKIFNPERHADDFMLVEEAYTNLFKSSEKRQLIDLFVLNPLDADELRSRLTILPANEPVSFEILDIPQTIPGPDYSHLEMLKMKPDEASEPLAKLLEINFKIPDWKII